MIARVISALLLIALIALPLWQGGFLFVALILLFGGLALREFYRLVETEAGHSLASLGMAVSAGLVLGASWQREEVVQLAISSLVVGGLIWELMLPLHHDRLRDWAMTLAGVLYIGWPMSLLVRLRTLPDGLWWIVVVIAATSACDSSAYFVGKWFGRRPFAPKYSPSKTWEGTLGGIGAALLVVFFLAPSLVGLPPWRALFLGALIGPAAVLGDLAESMIKRRVGVKDSGALIPGHGGMLDRVDSLIFAVTVIYFFALWLG
ncbi:MAG: phosphatidate cytidylyltransferase [Ardenticatenia bacterium]|nr:phosphatidate cytidylyltransferase [Ardenticatenia bacterium]